MLNVAVDLAVTAFCRSTVHWGQVGVQTNGA